MFRNRGIHGRIAAVASIAALTGAMLAVGQAPGGASTPRAATLTPTTGINGLCGGIVAGTLPPNLRHGEAQSNTLHVYREKADYAVAATSIPVDFTALGLYAKASNLPNPR